MSPTGADDTSVDQSGEGDVDVQRLDVEALLSIAEFKIKVLNQATDDLQSVLDEIRSRRIKGT